MPLQLTPARGVPLLPLAPMKQITSKSDASLLIARSISRSTGSTSRCTPEAAAWEAPVRLFVVTWCLGCELRVVYDHADYWCGCESVFVSELRVYFVMCSEERAAGWLWVYQIHVGHVECEGGMREPLVPSASAVCPCCYLHSVMGVCMPMPWIFSEAFGRAEVAVREFYPFVNLSVVLQGLQRQFTQIRSGSGPRLVTNIIGRK